MSKKTPLYEQHQQAGAKLVDFSGFSMPLHYGSQLQEHIQVRQQAGMFDVSHMGVLDIEGNQAKDFLRYTLANDVNKLISDGWALYSCLLNEQGGVIDDLIAYRISPNHYRLILNAGRRQADLAWLQNLAKDFEVSLNLRDDVALLAVQGPTAIDKVCHLVDQNAAQAIQALKPFTSVMLGNMQIARTGYTGEHGVEIVLPTNQATDFWQRLVNLKVMPCGLGARDTLRLEAGLNLYGSDMDETTTPLESNLGWTICWQDSTRDFVGRDALLEKKQQGTNKKLVGLMMKTPGVLRCGQTVIVDDKPIGTITSGGFSPTLGHAIALARLSLPLTGQTTIDRRGKQLNVELVKPPFVRFNQPIYQEYKQ